MQQQAPKPRPLAGRTISVSASLDHPTRFSYDPAASYDGAAPLQRPLTALTSCRRFTCLSPLLSLLSCESLQASHASAWCFTTTATTCRMGRIGSCSTLTRTMPHLQAAAR